MAHDRIVSDLHWEYREEHIDISTLAHPSGSVPSLSVIYRRAVSEWKVYKPTDRIADLVVEPGDDI